MTGASLATLSALADKSLLHTRPSGRYELHETLRQYAGEKLQAASEGREATHDRHSSHYLELLRYRVYDESAGGFKEREALAAIAAEIDNVRAAWGWAVAHDRLAEICTAMHGLHYDYQTCDLFWEGAEVFRQLAEQAGRASAGPEPDPQRAFLVGFALISEAWFHFDLLRIDRAKAGAHACEALLPSAGSPRLQAEYLLLRGMIAASQGPYAEAQPALWECVAITRETGQRLLMGFALQGLGIACMALGEYAEARRHLIDGLTIHRAIDHQRGIRLSLQFLGDVARALGEHTEAHQRYTESMAVSAAAGDRVGMAIALGHLGSLARTIGAYEDAEQRYHESLAIFTVLSHRLGMAMVLGNLGRVAFAQGNVAEARQLHQASLVFSRESGNPRSISRSLCHLGTAACTLGAYQEAHQCLREALRTALKIGADELALDSLAGLAALAAAEGNAEQAIELLALTLHHPAAARRSRERAGRLLSELAERLPPEIVAAAHERGRQRDLWATGQELLEELEAAGWGAA